MANDMNKCPVCQEDFTEYDYVNTEIFREKFVEYGWGYCSNCNKEFNIMAVYNLAEVVMEEMED